MKRSQLEKKADEIYNTIVVGIAVRNELKTTMNRTTDKRSKLYKNRVGDYKRQCAYLQGLGDAYYILTGRNI